MVALGGVPVVVEAMRLHPLVVDVQRFGCGALYNLAMLAENVKKITAAGGGEAVRDAMRAHPSVMEVQHWGRGALHGLESAESVS